MGISNKCQAGCMSFYGGEVKHRRDCVHYPESLTRLWHDTEAELMSEIDRLRSALNSIYTENMHCAGDADSMAMCIVSTQGVARDALYSTEKEKS